MILKSCGDIDFTKVILTPNVLQQRFLKEQRTLKDARTYWNQDSELFQVAHRTRKAFFKPQ